MLYVAGEIIVWMVLAFALGLLVGWFVWGLRQRKTAPAVAPAARAAPPSEVESVTVRPVPKAAPVAAAPEEAFPVTPPAGQPAVPLAPPMAPATAPEDDLGERAPAVRIISPTEQAEHAQQAQAAQPAPSTGGEESPPAPEAAATAAATGPGSASPAPAGAAPPPTFEPAAGSEALAAPPPVAGSPTSPASEEALIQLGGSAEAVTPDHPGNDELAALVADEPAWSDHPPTPAHGQPVTAAQEPAAATTPAAPLPDTSGAASALGRPVAPDDLKVISGVDDRIEAILRESGIVTWRDLASASPERLRTLLDLAGDQFRVHDPASWPEQAGLAADGRWGELALLQASL